MSRYVPGVGPKDAKIVFVGEAPGAEEDKQGVPFVGGSGYEFNKLLSAVGVDRNSVYITNVVKQRPPNNNFDIFYNDSKQNEPSPFLTHSIEQLHAEIREIRPNVICALGGEALRAITGRRGIERWRGSILSSPLGKVVATYHPAFVLRKYSVWPIAFLDLRRVLNESRYSSIDVSKPTIEVDPSYERVIEFLKSRPSRVAVDIETTKNITRCIGFADSPDHAIVIPLISSGNLIRPGDTTILLDHGHHSGMMNSHWTEEEEYEILRRLDEFLLDPRTEKVLQNFPFDSTVLGNDFGFDIRGFVLDTLVAHHTCYCELPKALDFLGSIYTKVPYYSDYDPSDDYQTWTYCGLDNIVTYQTAIRLEQELKSHGTSEFYYNHVHPSILAFSRCQNDGIRVDQPERSRQAIAMRERIEVLTKEIQLEVGDPAFNPSSPKQMANYLYGKLRLPPVLHHKEKRPTTDKNAMETLAKKYPARKKFFDSVREHGSKETLLSGFLEHPLGRDGRIRTSYNVAGTVTGRLSSSEHFLFESTNLQNIEKADAKAGKITRRCFVADDSIWRLVDTEGEKWEDPLDEEVLIKADYGAAEWRIVVWLVPIRRFIEQYQNDPPYKPNPKPFDVHRWAAARVYNIDEGAVVKEQRDNAKNGVYGGNYGMHAPRASMLWKKTVHEAQFILSSYHRIVPEVSQIWWPRVQREISLSRTIVGPLGRKRVFYGRLDDEMFRGAYSHSAQHIVGDLINRAFTLYDEIANPLHSRTKLQVHDEIVLSCKKRHVRENIELLRSLMEYPIYFKHPPEVEPVTVPLILPADISVGLNWMDQKPAETWLKENEL